MYVCIRMVCVEQEHFFLLRFFFLFSFQQKKKKKKNFFFRAQFPKKKIFEKKKKVEHTCAHIAGGIVYCFGRNNNGQTGTGSSDSFVLTFDPVVKSNGDGLYFDSIASGGKK